MKIHQRVIPICLLLLLLCSEGALAASIPNMTDARHHRRRRRHASTSIFKAFRQMIYKPFDSTIERRNFTLVIQRLQLENIPGKGPLMYCRSANPFDLGCSAANSVTAYQKIDHVDDGRGDGTCRSKGLRGRTVGQLDPFHFYTSLNQSVDFQRVRANLTGLRLSEFSHVNVVDRKKRWNITGQAGDTRVYINGTFEMTDGDRILISAKDVKWFQNLSYPAPVGNANGDAPKIAAYFTGKINEFESDEEWVDVVDPYFTGYLLGVVRALAMGVDDCYRSASFWITMRAFPDLGTGTYDSDFIQHNTADIGAKVGPYTGSPSKNIEQAESLGNLSITMGVTTIAIASTTSIFIAATTTVLPATDVSTVAMPGNGAVRMIRNSAFIARLGQIRGFQTDSFKEYASKMDVFLVKFPLPFGRTGSSAEETARRKKKKKRSLSKAAVRQADEEDDDGNGDDDDDDDPSVSDDIFKGCAFYTMSAFAAVLLVHMFVGFWIRKRPIEEQVGPHAWMIYILSMVMEYVHTSSILNASQYFRSHIGMGTGKTILYFVAAIQFLTVGLGFFLFNVIVVGLALYRLQRRDVNYLPRFTHPDPDIRRSAVVAGEYQAEDDNFFHGVFEGVYSGYAGPRIWLVLIEAFVGFVDTIITAVIWDELIVLTILLSLYVFLYAIFLVLGPHVDKIEGRLVSILGFIDLVLLFLEFLSALGNYETADTMDNLAISMGTISMAIGLIITIYCDVIPTSLTAREWISGYVLAILRKLRLIVPVNVESISDWSALSNSLARTLSRAPGSNDGEVAEIQQTQTQSSSNEEEEEEIQEEFVVPISLRASLWRRKSVQRWRRQDQTEPTEDYSSSSREMAGTNYHTGVANYVRDSESVVERIDVSQRKIESVWHL